MDLTRGANTALTGENLRIAVDGVRQGAVDLLVLQLTEQRRVRTDNDLIFFNQPASPEGAVKLTGGGAVEVSLGRVPAAVSVLAIAVSLDDSVRQPLAAVGSLGVTIAGGGHTVRARIDGLSSERSALLVEIYRRDGGWKVRNVSQGWTAGLAAVLREHGVHVEEPKKTVAAPMKKTFPGEERLSLEKRQKLDMRKREVARVLLTKRAADVRAKVVVVMDNTASMTQLYQRKVPHRVIERMVPVAVHLDDDGTLETYLYATDVLRLPDLRVGDLETWPETYLHLRGRHNGIDYDAIGGVNDEIPVINTVLRDADPRQPTLVLFFTDGGFHKAQEITNLIVEAAKRPIFWQFVGIGASQPSSGGGLFGSIFRVDYGILEKLDTMPGRVVDNAGFFALDDVDSVSDAELYERLLTEFPSWLQAAKAAGILR